ncbi:MAG: pentapeptide repeat-containing protein [Pseudomonadota bacterium]
MPDNSKDPLPATKEPPSGLLFKLRDPETRKELRKATAQWIKRRWTSLTGWIANHYLAILIPFGLVAITLATVTYIWQIPGLIGRMLSELQAALDTDDLDTTDIRNIGYTFAALAGMLAILATIPFQLVRVWINERTARTQEANLTTSLLNSAVEGLGADKKISRIGRPVTFSKAGDPDRTEIEWQGKAQPSLPGEDWARENGAWQTFDASAPNLEVRIGAILTLDRIARENREEHIRVMDILCAYIRENAPASGAEDHGLGDWPDYPESPTADIMQQRRGALWERREKLEKWVNDLPDPRTDIQKAMEVIGNRDPESVARIEDKFVRDGETGYWLDLRKTNLRKCNLSHLDFRRARFGAARMEGANLEEAWMGVANLEEAWMGGANLVKARMEGANLVKARMEGANLVRAQMEGANLEEARMERANLEGARMESANLVKARMESANLSIARMERAILRWAQMEGAMLFGAQIERVNLLRARMESANLEDARMESANLSRARMERANLKEAQMDGANLSEANLKSAEWAGAHMRSPAHSADFRGGQDLTQAQLDQMIGDANTLLPDGLAPDTGEAYSIPSKWRDAPPFFDEMLQEHWKYGFDSADDLRDAFLCAEGEEPERTGTPLPLDAPYPEGHPLAPPE